MKHEISLNVDVSEASIRWNQKEHCAFEDDIEKDVPHVELKAVSNGIARFLVINSFEFAISDEGELKLFMSMIKSFMDKYCGEDKK